MYPSVKRIADVAIAATGLVFLSPVLAVIALLVRQQLGAPVLFRQQRPGLHGDVFELVKFRTMLDGDAPDGERLTPFGKALRRTSLDELPELVNVLRGDMSVVGPRPLLVRYLPLYTPRQQRRHDVRPGITGLAQVEGRNGLDWGTRLELDVRYTESISLGQDLRILVKTISRIISGNGVTAEGMATGRALEDYLATVQDE